MHVSLLPAPTGFLTSSQIPTPPIQTGDPPSSEHQEVGREDPRGPEASTQHTAPWVLRPTLKSDRAQAGRLFLPFSPEPGGRAQDVCRILQPVSIMCEHGASMAPLRNSDTFFKEELHVSDSLAIQCPTNINALLTSTSNSPFKWTSLADSRWPV